VATTDPVERSIDSLNTAEFRMANKTYVFVKQHRVSSNGTPGCIQQLPSQVLVSDPPHEAVQRASVILAGQIVKNDETGAQQSVGQVDAT